MQGREIHLPYLLKKIHLISGLTQITPVLFKCQLYFASHWGYKGEWTWFPSSNCDWEHFPFFLGHQGILWTLFFLFQCSGPGTSGGIFFLVLIFSFYFLYGKICSGFQTTSLQGHFWDITWLYVGESYILKVCIYVHLWVLLLYLKCMTISWYLFASFF